MDTENLWHAQSYRPFAGGAERLPSTDPTQLIVAFDIHPCLLECEIISRKKFESLLSSPLELASPFPCARATVV
jgi:hypothetical protein